MEELEVELISEAEGKYECALVDIKNLFFIK